MQNLIYIYNILLQTNLNLQIRQSLYLFWLPKSLFLQIATHLD